jgi:ferredoxin-NADP reductase
MPATEDGLAPLPAFAAVNRRPPPGGARRDWQRALVVAMRRETPRALSLRLELPHWVAHTPGQHYVVRLTAPDGYQAQRSYSVASPPADAPFLELTVERLVDGEVSSYLHDGLRRGDELEIRGPFGGWFTWRGDRAALLVGGGSGVVPLMAMLRHRRREDLDVLLRLVVSARTPEDLLYAGEYGRETTVVYTRAAPPGTLRAPRRLDAGDLRPLLSPGAMAYVCGSAGFAEHASQLLVALGQPAGDIRVERFGPT